MIPLLALTHAVGLIEVVTKGRVDRNHTCMTGKGTVDNDPILSMYITITCLGRVDEKLRKHQKVG